MDKSAAGDRAWATGRSPVSSLGRARSPGGDVSGTVESGSKVLGRPGADGGRGGNGTRGLLVRGLGVFVRQREATVLVVTIALLLYFGLSHASTFVSQTNAVDLLSELMAPIAIIAIGEVLLLICGEIDLSVG